MLPTSRVKYGLLVASPQLPDPNFARTVILLVENDAEGSLGFVINRPTDLTLETVLDQLAIPHDEPFGDPVMWGGPVRPNAGFLLFKGEHQPGDESAIVLPGGLMVSSSSVALEMAVTGRIARPFMMCVGYAGWGEGQLDDEIRRGSWIVLDLDETLVFQTPLRERWDQAIGKLGIETHEIWMNVAVDE